MLKAPGLHVAIVFCKAEAAGSMDGFGLKRWVQGRIPLCPLSSLALPAGPLPLPENYVSRGQCWGSPTNTKSSRPAFANDLRHNASATPDQRSAVNNAKLNVSREEDGSFHFQIEGVTVGQGHFNMPEAEARALYVRLGQLLQQSPTNSRM